jgi:hypothetical protein
MEKRSALPNRFRLKSEQLLAQIEAAQTKQTTSEPENNFEDAIDYQSS